MIVVQFGVNIQWLSVIVSLFIVQVSNQHYESHPSLPSPSRRVWTVALKNLSMYAKSKACRFLYKLFIY